MLLLKYSIFVQYFLLLVTKHLTKYATLRPMFRLLPSPAIRSRVL